MELLRRLGAVVSCMIMPRVEAVTIVPVHSTAPMPDLRVRLEGSYMRVPNQYAAERRPRTSAFRRAQKDAGDPPAGGRGAAPHGEPTGTWPVPRSIWPFRPHVERRSRRKLCRPSLWRNHLMDVSMVESRWWQLRRAFVVSLVESREDSASRPPQHSRQGFCA